MKCYYEELGVARDAIDADIKSSYRKLALRWHPDKNPDCLEEAKERFQLIQQAYEVLSDPHERCWYDNHREQILRGKNSDYEENCLDVFQYFSVACFKGYGDDTKGFYTVYREVFEKIAAEDAEFLEDEESVLEIPKFGDSESSYDDVVGPFYAYWQAYCTKKTYAWLCPYDIQEIKDRRVLREIEKEMKKIVQKARKERNEEIRNLVSFIRKRDRRVQAYRRQLEERAFLNRQKQEQNRLDQIRRRQQELEQIASQGNEHHDKAEYEEQLRQLEQHYGGDSSCEEVDSAEEEEEDVDAESPEEVYLVDNLYCVACNKTFKNEKAYANHESSKKHRDIVERMKLAMLAEEEAYKDASGEDNTNVSNAIEEISSDEYDEIDNQMPEDDLEVAPISAENDNLPDSIHKTTNKRNKKSRRTTKSTMPLPTAGEETLDEIHTDEFLKQAIAVDNDADNWDKTGKKSKGRNKKQVKKCAETKTAANEIETSQDVARAVETDAPTVVRTTPAAVAADATATSLHMCVTCKASFPSKNKLFAHLKITNHGVYLPKAKAENTKPKNAKGHRK